MVASMAHRLNVDGVERFLAECWPEIKRLHPSAIFKIAGVAMTRAQQTKWARHDGVRPLGFVANLAELYADAALAVVPISEGGGTKIKVLEAFRHGRAVALTRHAHRGYERTLPAATSAAVADSPAALVATVVRLLQSPEERRARAHEGWRLVNEHYSWEAFRRAVQCGVDAALAAPAPRSPMLDGVYSGGG
jgi:glycosyltransferase involved in cell wall biosynthesis